MKKILFSIFVICVAFTTHAATTNIDQKTKISSIEKCSLVTQIANTKTVEVVASDFGCDVTVTVYGPLGEIFFQTTTHSSFMGDFGCYMALKYAIDQLNSWLDKMSEA